MPHPPDPDTFGFLIYDIARMLRSELDRRTTEAGFAITPAERRALANAARLGPVRQNVLAECMSVEPMTLSACLDRLEEAGYVERRPDPTDRRAKLVHVRDEATSVLAELAPVVEAVRSDAARGVTTAEWQAFMRVLKLVRNNIADGRKDAPQEDNPA